ncbi:MAG: hypothetical protein ACM3U0_01820 [archaeon]
MKNITLILLCCLILLPLKIQATAQISDLLIVGKDTVALYSLPLEVYLEKHNISSDIFREDGFSTGCARQYRAVWEIRNDSLFLIDLLSCVSDTGKIPFSVVFGKHNSGGPEFASWLVSDTLWAEVGNQVFYEHVGFGWYYDKEVAYHIVNGIVKDTTIYNYKDKIYISELDKDDFHRRNFLCDSINWNELPVPEKEIKILVSLRNNECKIVKTPNGTGKVYINEALRVVRSLRTTVMYQHGARIDFGYFIPVIFSKEFKDDCRSKR